MITLTPTAVSEIKRMLEREKEKEIVGLRLLVKGGGCSGLSYGMNFDKKKQGDNEYTFEGLKVFVDPKSYLYLEGTTLDYADQLEGRGFKFINPKANKTCGCGESFSV
ncbi:MAG TPA: iron-sulfur cluster assembly accessory protein [Verrucomicrobiae bacterium]|jgi:iron-sulfur cluster assembly protein|nr:iron-sulfur cluster assembly accessory protein [Verrucomicrobiae bacterium]